MSPRFWTQEELDTVDAELAWYWDNPHVPHSALQARLRPLLPNRTHSAILQKIRERIVVLKRERIIPLAEGIGAEKMPRVGLSRNAVVSLVRSASRRRVQQLVRLELEDLLAGIGAMVLHPAPGDAEHILRLGTQALRLEAWLARQGQLPTPRTKKNEKSPKELLRSPLVPAKMAAPPAVNGDAATRTSTPRGQ